jgi:predicted CXXCH cytochrome family protein
MSKGKATQARTESTTDGAPKIRRVLVTMVFVVSAILAPLWLKRHPVGASKLDMPRTSEAAKSTNLVRDQKRILASYAGSATCKACHAEQFKDWEGSHHGLAERGLKPELDLKAFEPRREFTHGSQHTVLQFTNSQYQAISQVSTGMYEGLAVERVIGVEPLRQFLVNFPGGRMQTLEASFDPIHDQWFNVYGNEDRQPGEWGHWTGRGMNWNSMCATCHNTRLLKNYNPATDEYTTAKAEISVGCEACHGPMKDHVEWSGTHPNSNQQDPTIHKLSPLQQLDTCLSCHSRRMELEGEFSPGESLDDHYLLTLPDETEIFYPDGQIHEEDYEGAPFLGSKMHSKGVSCGDCHQPHTSKLRLPGNMLCMRCHNGSVTNAPVIVPATHSFHKTDPLYDTAAGADLKALAGRDAEQTSRSGGECVNCHMPQTIYMQRHRRHDHGFTIPDPLLTKELGIPNACNRCHRDKDTDWAVSWTEKWYGSKMDRPSRQRTRLVAGGRQEKAESKDGLVALLTANENPYWSAVAANLLGRWIGEPAVRSALVKAVSDTNALVRAQAVHSLGPLAEGGDSMVALEMTKRLSDPARIVRFVAAWGLRANLGERGSAVEELLETLDFLSDQPVGQMQKGAWFLSRNKPGDALAAYQKAVEWDPNSAPIRHDLGVVLSMLRRSPEAVQQLETACRLQPKDAEYRYKLALAYNEMGQSDMTMKNLEETVRLNPQHARAWYNLGLAKYSAGSVEDALTALVRAESTDSNDPRSPYARATILAKLGRTDEARRAAQRALEIQPNFPEAQQLLEALPQTRR